MRSNLSSYKKSRHPDLTRRELQFVLAMETFHSKNGYMPSSRELARVMGYSSIYTTRNVLNRLKAKHYLLDGKDGNRKVFVFNRELIPTEVDRLRARAEGAEGLLRRVHAKEPIEGELLMDICQHFIKARIKLERKSP